MDTRATTFDDEKPHPDSHAVLDHLRTLPWVRDVAVRTRDQGQFFHVEAFIVPVDDALPSWPTSTARAGSATSWTGSSSTSSSCSCPNSPTI